MSLGDKPLECWTENDVSSWLSSIRLKQEYITKLHEEEATGAVLKILSERDLGKMGMKKLQIQLLLRKRDELLEKEIQRKSPKREDKGERISSINPPDTGSSSAKHKTEGEDQRNSNILQEKPRDTQSDPTKNKEQTHQTNRNTQNEATPYPGMSSPDVNKLVEKQSIKSPSSEEGPREITKKKKKKKKNSGANTKPHQTKEGQPGEGEETTSGKSTVSHSLTEKMNPSGNKTKPPTENSLENKEIPQGTSPKKQNAPQSDTSRTHKENITTEGKPKTQNPCCTSAFVEPCQPPGKKSEQPPKTKGQTDTKDQFAEGLSQINVSSENKPQQNICNPTSENKLVSPEINNIEPNQVNKPVQKSKKKKSKTPHETINQKQKDGQHVKRTAKAESEDKPQENQRKSCSDEKSPTEQNYSIEGKLPEMNINLTKRSIEEDQLPQRKSINVSEEHQDTMSPEDKNQIVAKSSERINGSKENARPVQKPKDLQSFTQSIFRPFNNHGTNVKYVKNQVLTPETGVINLITPCHEYKSFLTAAGLDRSRLLAKLRYETFKFAAACLNMRTNGTIHFGITDRVEDEGFRHGQIVGIPIYNIAWYADLKNDLDQCFTEASEYEAAAACIYPPEFIEVVDAELKEKRFVVEVDIEPLFIRVKEKTFHVCLPKFDKKNNKTFYQDKTIYERIGTTSQSIKIEEINAVNHRRCEADKRRKEAEEANVSEAHRYENLGRKVSVLLTNGKQYFDDTLQYVLITNRCENHQLQHLTFLKYLKMLCVFDFDAESDTSGLHSKCKDYHLSNIFSLKSYASEYGKNLDDIINNLGFFKHTSWIFCNGRKSFDGEDLPCDEQSWIKDKMKHFKKAVSLICDNIKKGSFIVLFMLFSPVEKPIVKALMEFYEELSGMEYITCITECEEYYTQWAGLAQATCNRTELDQRSVVGMQLSHVDATVQNMIPEKNFNRTLPVSTKGVCFLTIPKEEKMNSLNILCVNECENTNLKAIDPKTLERDFYRGGKISWKHLWLAEQKKCGAFIERHACQEVEGMLNGILNEDTVKLPVARINIFHQPGSGGSTVARQILWKNKKNLRCAIVNSRYQTTKVCEHAVELREYEEGDTKNCLPVLLLLEDCTEEYIDELKHSLQEVMIHKQVRRAKTRFILLTCKRSNAPEKSCSVSPIDTVAITHKLRDNEKLLFKDKAEELNETFPSDDMIITFVLMSQEFNKKYLEDFVKNVMEDLDHSSPVTRLIRYTALLNHYVQNSYISLSHCEVLLGIQSFVTQDYKLSQNHDLNSLSEQALIMEQRDELTFISAIRILHPLIAGEIINQYSTRSYPQSKIALELLNESAALNHRFAKQEFVKFIKDLFFRRHKKSRGDNADSFFSPLIEHVCKEERDTEMAIKLLQVAFEQFDKDAHFAQQLARLHYKNSKFEEAKKWVGTAKAKLPDDSYILDTEGRLYKEWFTANHDKYKENGSSGDEISLIELGLKSMECFREAQRAANNDKDTINNSGYMGEVDIGCNLLELLLTLFKNIKKDKAELVEYLTDVKYIPEEIKDSWANLHGHLKSLYQKMYNTLEWISEDVGCFQGDKIDVWETTKKDDFVRNWLVRQTKIFADCFRSVDWAGHSAKSEGNKFARKMAIYSLGGSSVATILSLLSNSKSERLVVALERIINYLPTDISEDKLDDGDLISLIMCHIALGSVQPDSRKLLEFKKLLEISQRFLNERKTFPASAYFLIFMLYWPDERFLTSQNIKKGNVLNFAMEKAKQLHQKRIKDVPVRKKRTNVLFFLGKGIGLQKFIFRSAIERLLNHPLNERTFRFDGDLKDRKLIQDKLKKVDGWTENRKVYTKGPFGKGKIEVLPLNYSSVPHGDENVTFYLGFTYIGYVTYGIEVKKTLKWI
ncbi:sterile alpha motif domain-containing protein 9-like [Rana temporaria]|uniref:sterile alpha motif domain-containing protein 9-like n=1 Tax=Rana temporaria TaxID=8407 RepID=UPI001AAD3400|nr:sterile alpha motif domain-containing protein 9-like [Rana temporaria]